MSINAFKKHSGNKITVSDRSLLCGELKVMGSRPKVIFCVHGTRKCGMQDMLFIVHYIGEQFIVTHPPSTSSSTVLWCCWQKPERMPRRMTACSRCRPSRSPTISLRRTRASRRRLTWRWCGLKQLSCRGSWVFAGHGHFVNRKRWHYWHVRAQTEY